jgi:hypothetical protein
MMLKPRVQFRWCTMVDSLSGGCIFDVPKIV